MPITAGAVSARRNAGGDTSTIGAFVEDDWTIGQLVLTGGVRGDRWTITDGFIREVAASGSVTKDQHFADRDGFEGTGRVGALFHAQRGDRASGGGLYRLPAADAQ